MKRRALLVGGAGLVLGGCFDRPCHERNPAQKAFLDGLSALAKPAPPFRAPLAAAPLIGLVSAKLPPGVM